MFNKFLNSLKTPKNASLVEAIQKGYNTIFEAGKARHIPGVYQDLKSYLKTLKDDGTIFVHFMNKFLPPSSNNKEIEVSDKELNKLTASKIGFNYDQRWGNPFGVYAYPYIEIFEPTGDFKKQADYYYVIKANTSVPHIKDIGEFPRNEYVTAIEKLKELYKKTILKREYQKLEDMLRISDDEEKTKAYIQEKIEDKGSFIDFLKKTEEESSNKSDGGILFYSIIRLSEKFLLNKTQNLSGYPISDKITEYGNNPNIIQRNIWVKVLGYEWINDNSSGIIHPSEAQQAIFMTPRSYKVIKQGHNKKYEMIKRMNQVKEGGEIPHFDRNDFPISYIQSLPPEQQWRLLTTQFGRFKNMFQDEPKIIRYFNKKIRGKIIDEFEYFFIEAYIADDLPFNDLIYFNEDIIRKFVKAKPDQFTYLIKTNVDKAFKLAESSNVLKEEIFNNLNELAMGLRNAHYKTINKIPREILMKMAREHGKEFADSYINNKSNMPVDHEIENIVKLNVKEHKLELERI